MQLVYPALYLISTCTGAILFFYFYRDMVTKFGNSEAVTTFVHW